MVILRIKTEEEFIHDYGNAWYDFRFPVNEWNSGGIYVALAPRNMLGEDIKLNNDEFDFYTQSGVIRYFNPNSKMMTLITAEMIAGEDAKVVKNGADKVRKYRRNKNIYKIYLPKQQIRLNPHATKILDDDVINSRMNFYKLKQY